MSIYACAKVLNKSLNVYIRFQVIFKIMLLSFFVKKKIVILVIMSIFHGTFYSKYFLCSVNWNYRAFNIFHFRKQLQRVYNFGLSSTICSCSNFCKYNQLSSNYYMLLRFALKCWLFKMKCVTVLVSLQALTKKCLHIFYVSMGEKGFAVHFNDLMLLHT